MRRLTDDERLSGDVADRWFDAWEEEAAGRELHGGDPAFWIDGHAWIISGLKARRRV